MGSAPNVGQTAIRFLLEYLVRVSQSHPWSRPALIPWGRAVPARQAIPGFVGSRSRFVEPGSSRWGDRPKTPRYSAPGLPCVRVLEVPYEIEPGKRRIPVGGIRNGANDGKPKGVRSAQKPPGKPALSSPEMEPARPGSVSMKRYRRERRTIELGFRTGLVGCQAEPPPAGSNLRSEDNVTLPSAVSNLDADLGLPRETTLLPLPFRSQPSGARSHPCAASPGQ